MVVVNGEYIGEFRPITRACEPGGFESRMGVNGDLETRMSKY